MGLARSILERLAIGIGHGQARDCRRLASQGIPTVLEVLGKVVELPEVGGLHHRYERRAA